MKKQTVKDWPEDDRPREKYMQRGWQALSNSEVLAILLNTGSPNLTVVELAKKLLELADNRLDRIAKMNVAELTRVESIGQSKAITILAALELARRLDTERTNNPQESIKSADQAYHYLKYPMAESNVEELWMLYLNKSNKVLKKTRLFIGGVSFTVVDPKVVFKEALDLGASGMIMAHNHPSGNLEPSPQDIDITVKTAKAAVLLGITFIDHLIISTEGYKSLKEHIDHKYA